MFGCDGISDHASWNEVFHYWDTNLSLFERLHFKQKADKCKKKKKRKEKNGKEKKGKEISDFDLFHHVLNYICQ